MVVIGAGTAGLVTAGAAAGLGARVALIERDLMGGDCLNTGCVPSKALLRCARSAADVRVADQYGIQADEPEVDFGAVMERVRRLRADIASHDSAQRFTDLGVEVFLGDARFTGRDSIEVGGTTLRFARACIATGARPAIPPIEGIDEVEYLTNETVFNLTDRPGAMAVIGGGPIGCEMAQAFARLGSRVFIVEMADRILGNDDPDAASIVHESLERDGVEIHTGATLASVKSLDGERVGLRVDRDGDVKELEADALLIAVGRIANIEDLGLEAAGIESDRRTGVVVDDRLRTTNPRVYAAGDVCSTYKFTHAADAMARTVARNALLPGGWSVDRLTIPWCTYTEPELAHVGLSYEAARSRGDVTTVRVDFEDVDRAILDGATEGFVALHVDQRGRVVGGTVVGPHAGDLIGELSLAVSRKTKITDLSNVIHPYPTLAESFRKAGDSAQRSRLRPWMASLLQRWMRWHRR